MFNPQYLKDLKKAGLLKHVNIPNNHNPLEVSPPPSVPINEELPKKDNQKKVSFDINSFFDKIYVLNLDHRQDRMSQMKEKLQKHGVTNYVRFPAVNGHQKPHIDFFRKLHFFFDTPGAYGVLMSAYSILVDAIKHNYQQILILEDDVIFHQDFTNLFNQKIKSIPSYWKLLFLGSSMHRWRLEQRCKIYPDYVVPRGSIPGAFALGIKSDCFLPLMSEIRKLNSSWDLGPIKYINSRFPNQCFVFKPNLVIADTRDSDIRDGKNLDTKCHDCNWELDKYDFKF